MYLSPNSSSLKITYCDRPSSLLWFLCQHHVVHCMSRKYIAASCWGVFHCSRFPKYTWPVPIPPAWEQDVDKGPACPSHSSGELQHAGDMGKQVSSALSHRVFKTKPPACPSLYWEFWSWMQLPSLWALFHVWDAHRSQQLPNFQCLLWMTPRI